MTDIIITGGRRNAVSFSPDRLAYCYDAGIYRIDFARKRIVHSHVERNPKEEIYVPEYTLSFRGAFLDGSEITTCTHSEIVTLDLESLKVTRRVSDYRFNDIHSVMQRGADIWFTSTGIDMVGRIGNDGRISMYPAIENAAERFDEKTDYRKVCTKPHQSHPNCLFSLDGDIWVTRFVQKDAVCVAHLSRRIDIGVERPHDGVVRDNRVYFTTVDGKVVECDTHKGAPVRVHDVAGLYRSGNPGWCRGLALEGDHAYVGFTTIRKTRSLENLSFLTDTVRMLGDMFKNNPPARIVKYNLRNGKIEDEMQFRPSEIGIVFSILKLKR